MKPHTLIFATLSLMPVITTAEPSHRSDYAGQETRLIKSLSPADIKDLKSGAGWGFAKAAELNGYPGPRHLLDLKAEIPLSNEQVSQIEVIYREMKKQAVEQGKSLIAKEHELETQFRARSIIEPRLRTLLAGIAITRAGLRHTHLAAHLKATAILSANQIARYNVLRGYGNGDPCATPPKGHDAAMWRKHNNCD
ncbi:MAG TPA: hypothetical protein DCS82_11145 [Rhodospirillaceae bacterium]|nr:hypothetical protein [Rhodospirillaceae bacterium]HAT36264.1 hypothetical protein [Rhodospirillaceae bacterium]